VAREKINDTTQRYMDEYIVERPKLLISLKNTYKQKKKTRMRGGG
jgi:hypothetical protein